jgi:hypothetical protein
VTNDWEIVWIRLAALGKACEFSMTSEIAAPGGLEPGRYWHVVIRPKRRGVMPIEVFDKSARSAVEDALARADAMGWPGTLGLGDAELDQADGRRADCQN